MGLTGPLIGPPERRQSLGQQMLIFPLELLIFHLFFEWKIVPISVGAAIDTLHELVVKFPMSERIFQDLGA